MANNRKKNLNIELKRGNIITTTRCQVENCCRKIK